MSIGGGLHDREPGRGPSRVSWWRVLVTDLPLTGLLVFIAALATRALGTVLVLLVAVLTALVGGIWIGYTGRGNEDFNKAIGRWLS